MKIFNFSISKIKIKLFLHPSQPEQSKKINLYVTPTLEQRQSLSSIDLDKAWPKSHEATFNFNSLESNLISSPDLYCLLLDENDFVIDCDGRDADLIIRDFLKSLNLLDTRIHKTRRGSHIFFKLSEDVKASSFSGILLKDKEIENFHNRMSKSKPESKLYMKIQEKIKSHSFDVLTTGKLLFDNPFYSTNNDKSSQFLNMALPKLYEVESDLPIRELTQEEYIHIANFLSTYSGSRGKSLKKNKDGSYKYYYNATMNNFAKALLQASSIEEEHHNVKHYAINTIRSILPIISSSNFYGGPKLLPNSKLPLERNLYNSNNLLTLFNMALINHTKLSNDEVHETLTLIDDYLFDVPYKTDKLTQFNKSFNPRVINKYTSQRDEALNSFSSKERLEDSRTVKSVIATSFTNKNDDSFKVSFDEAVANARAKIEAKLDTEIIESVFDKNNKEDKKDKVKKEPIHNKDLNGLTKTVVNILMEENRNGEDINNANYFSNKEPDEEEEEIDENYYINPYKQDYNVMTLEKSKDVAKRFSKLKHIRVSEIVKEPGYMEDVERVKEKLQAGVPLDLDDFKGKAFLFKTSQVLVPYLYKYSHSYGILVVNEDGTDLESLDFCTKNELASFAASHNIAKHFGYTYIDKNGKHKLVAETMMIILRIVDKPRGNGPYDDTSQTMLNKIMSPALSLDWETDSTLVYNISAQRFSEYLKNLPSIMANPISKEEFEGLAMVKLARENVLPNPLVFAMRMQQIKDVILRDKPLHYAFLLAGDGLVGKSTWAGFMKHIFVDNKSNIASFFNGGYIEPTYNKTIWSAIEDRWASRLTAHCVFLDELGSATGGRNPNKAPQYLVEMIKNEIRNTHMTGEYKGSNAVYIPLEYLDYTLAMNSINFDVGQLDNTRLLVSKCYKSIDLSSKRELEKWSGGRGIREIYKDEAAAFLSYVLTTNEFDEIVDKEELFSRPLLEWADLEKLQDSKHTGDVDSETGEIKLSGEADDNLILADNIVKRLRAFDLTAINKTYIDKLPISKSEHEFYDGLNFILTKTMRDKRMPLKYKLFKDSVIYNYKTKVLSKGLSMQKDHPLYGPLVNNFKTAIDNLLDGYRYKGRIVYNEFKKNILRKFEVNDARDFIKLEIEKEDSS